MDSEHLEFLVQIATWYYEESLSQGEIARRIGLSRSMVSRLLREAREQGLIEIRVRYPLKMDSVLQTRLCETFACSQALVLSVPPKNQSTLLRCLGELGARCLRQRLHNDIRIGIGWGTAVYEVVRAMPSLPISGAMVVQIIGSVGSGDPTVDGSEMAHCLDQKLNAASRCLHAPLIVENEVTARSLFQSPVIAETLALACEVEVALLGVGTTNPLSSGLLRAGYVSKVDLKELQEAGAVGDILGWHLDVHGFPLDISINRRVIGINPETLRSIPMVIVVASGAVKVPAILATLRGGYVDVLVTDAVTASSILALQED